MMRTKKRKLRRTENSTTNSQCYVMRHSESSSSHSKRKLASPSMKSVSDHNVKLNGDLKAPPNNNNSSNNVETERWPHASLSSEDVGCLCLRDLIRLEQQFRSYLGRIRAKKEDLLLEQLGDLKEVIKALRSTNGNSNTLEKSMDSGLSEIIGSQNLESQGDSEHCCPHEAPLSDDSSPLWADISERTEQTNQDLPAAKHSGIA